MSIRPVTPKSDAIEGKEITISRKYIARLIIVIDPIMKD